MLNACGRPQLLELARRPVHRQPAVVRQRDAALGRRLCELGRVRLDAGRQPEQPVAVRRELQLLRAQAAGRHARAQVRRLFLAGRLQQVPGSARRRHRRRGQRLPAVLRQRRAVRGAALQLAVRQQEHRQLHERLLPRQLAHRRAAHGELRPAHRTLQRVPAGAVQAGRSVFGRGRLRRRPISTTGNPGRRVSAFRIRSPPTTRRSSRRPTGASTSRCARRIRARSGTSTRTTTRRAAIAGRI